MLMENGIHSNGIHHHALTYPACPIDYEAMAPADTKARPEPQWRDQFPTFTHNVSWVDTDSKQHSLTIRGDDLDEMLATLAAVKHCIRASKAQAAEKALQAETPAESQPDVQHCAVHGVDMPRRWSKRTNGHYFGHKLVDGSFCYGRAR